METLQTDWFRDKSNHWFRCRGPIGQTAKGWNDTSCNALLKYRPYGPMHVRFLKNNIKGGWEVYCSECGHHNGWIPTHPRDSKEGPQGGLF